METTDRLPPHSIEAEQGVLGCLLLDPERALNAAAERLRAGRTYFYDLRHQTIFNALMDLHEAQKGIDLVTVSQHLKDRHQLEEVGGTAYLASLPDCVPSAANLAHYLDHVWNKYTLRRMIALCTNAVGRAYDYQGEAKKMIDELESEVSGLTEEQSAEIKEKSIKEIVLGVVDDMQENHYTRGSTQLRGLPTGPPGNYLDKVIRGIGPQQYMVLAGRPGDGKTSKAMNIVEYLVYDYVWREPTGKKLTADNGDEYPETIERRGIPVAVFSIEMDAQSLGYRLVFGRAGVDTAEYYQGFAKKTDDPSLVAATRELVAGRLWVDDAPGQSIGQIAAKARRMAKQYGIKLFVLDYIQLVEMEGGNGMDRQREITKISRKIMALKKQLQVPWLVLAQMNRNIETSETKRTPILSDLKDCGALEQDADIVALMYRPEIKRLTKEQREEGVQTDEQIIASATAGMDWSKVPYRVNVNVAKHRNGPTGIVEEVFAKNLCRFEDWHRWKTRHGVEGYKAGERAQSLGLTAEQQKQADLAEAAAEMQRSDNDGGADA